MAILNLLDVSATFDCVDHSKLLHHLEYAVDIAGTVLNWIRSFLHDSTQQVVYSGQSSTTPLMPYGVPQGSTLCLLCFYKAGLFQIVTHHGDNMHQYADDTQLYLGVPPKVTD